MSTSTGRPDDTSFLVNETKKMQHQQRQLEQQGLRALTAASVKEGEYVPEDVVQEIGEAYGEALKEHPLLDSQLHDGIENNPPDPRLSHQAREKYKEEQRKQEHEKQLRLELQLQNQPTYRPSTAPRPKGP